MSSEMDVVGGSTIPRSYRPMLIRIANALMVLLALRRTMSYQLARTYLQVVDTEGLTVSDLAARCVVDKTVMSRHLHELGSHGGGLELVTMTQDVYGDRRERRVYLTALGAQVAREISEALKDPRPRLRRPPPRPEPKRRPKRTGDDPTANLAETPAGLGDDPTERS